MPELRHDWTAEDLARGEAVLTGWNKGQVVNTYADNFRGVLAMQANADSLYPEGFVSELLGGGVLGDSYEQAKADHKAGDLRGTAYLANAAAIRWLFNTSRRVEGGEPVLKFPTLPAGVPIVVAAAVVGVAAVAGLTWWGVDRNEREAEVEVKRAAAAAEVQIYVARVKAAVDTQTPIPEPPDMVKKFAAVEASTSWWLLGFGAIGGAMIVGAAWFTTSRPKYQTVRVNNPTRPRRRLRKRRNPTRAPRRKTSTKRKRAPQRKPNPLRQGYSRATVAANVAEMKRKGYPERQAVAAAMRSARASWRKKNPRGGYPAHLQTAAERRGKKRTTTKRKRNPKKKRVVVAIRKKNPKKRAAKKKANPKRRKAGSPPKGATPRAKWVRAQMRKGRSKKQAEALWKGQQAMKKKRRASKKTKRKRNPKARAGASRRR